MVKKRWKNKLLKFCIISSSLFLIMPLFFNSIFLENNYSIEKHNIDNFSFNNYKNNENLKQESKRSVGFPIYTLQKTGNDLDRNVLFVFGEGYSKNDYDKFINDLRKKVDQLFEQEPYKFFSNDFNVYGIMPESNASGDFFISGKENNYFGTYFSSVGGNRSPNVTKIDKFIELENKIKNNFLDEGGEIFNSVILCNSDVHFGAAGYVATFSLSDLNGVGYLMAHEMAHKFANLADEYLLDYGSLEENPNRTKESDPNKVRWKEFFNYKNIGMIKSGNSYIPSNNCKMGYGKEGFCEVCKHEMFTAMNKKIENKKELYIGEPFISLEHNLSKLDYYELGSTREPLINAKNKKIDFRTIIHNYSGNSKKIKLELKISDKNGIEKKKWVDEFDVKSNELKNIFILTEQINIDINDDDVIFGRVIDLDSNKEIANTNKDKNNYYNLKINYKLIENNNTTNNFIDGASISNIKVKKSTNIKLFTPNISQYQFIKKDKDIDEIINIDKDYEITFYYKKLSGKNIILNLLELDGKTIIQTREQTIYENEIFTPNIKDFIVDSEQKIKRVIVPKEVITYDNVTNGKEINYTYEISAKPYIIANDISISLNSNFNPLDYAKGFSYEWIEYPNLLKVESNNVDTSKPGYYNVTYSMTDNEGFMHNYVDIGGTTTKTINVTVLNSDGSLPANKPNPNPPVDQNDNDLNAEISRINSMTFSLKKEKYTEEEINKITIDTILEYVNSWNPKTEFTYSVINFLKENNTFKFNIKVSKNDKTSNSKEFILNYIIISNDKFKSEVNNEINKINSLDISLKKQEYSNNELNETNLLNELNFDKNNNFEYRIVQFSNKNNTISFRIQVVKNLISQDSKEFSLAYKLISNKNIENKNLIIFGKQEIILLSILIPLTIVVMGIVSWLFIFKKEK